MYVLYKLAQIPLRPEVWILVLVALAAWRRSRGLAIAAAIVFYALATRPVHDLLVRPLENVQTPGPAEIAAVDAVVVLGGGAVYDAATGAPTVLGTRSLDRLVCGIALAGTARTLVLAGGVGDPFGHSPTEAPAMRELALTLGVPEARITVDDRSRTTAENAARVRELVGGDARIAVTTSASHLRRALRRFRKEGMSPVGVPCDRLAPRKRWDVNDFVPRARRLANVGDAIHEWVGIALGR